MPVEPVSRTRGVADLPCSPLDIVQVQLRPGETLAWTDRPAPAVLDPRRTVMFILSVILLPFGAFVLGYGFVNLFDGNSGLAGVQFAQGLVFMAMAFAFSFETIGPSLRASWTIYAVTDQRAMIVKTFLRTTVRSYSPQEIGETSLLEREQEYGHVIFAKRKQHWLFQDREFRRNVGVGFFRINNAEVVEAKLRSLRAQAAVTDPSGEPPPPSSQLA